MLKKIKWITVEQHYCLFISKTIHKIINNDKNNQHYLSTKIKDNRTIRMISENKLGPKQVIDKKNIMISKMFAWRSKDIFNQIPRQLTLLKNTKRFKKCIMKYTIDPNTKFIIPHQDDFKEDLTIDLNTAIDFSCPC